MSDNNVQNSAADASKDNKAAEVTPAVHTTANDGAIDPKLGHAGDAHTGKPFEIAPEHAHDRIDSKDQRSLKNNIKDAKRIQEEQDKADEIHIKPTEIAKAHGNEPSRGAKIDEKLEDEEAAIIAKMDEKKAAAQHK